MSNQSGRLGVGLGADVPGSAHLVLASGVVHLDEQSYVTHLIEFGYPERFVTEQVGHSYASTTAIYTSVSSDFKTKTLQAALGRVYPSEGSQ